ncbi:MAG: nitroreductase [Deltaproteobacteria bacterium]|nr:nitroreductase [Deltaproteobacteria bacterium]
MELVSAIEERCSTRAFLNKPLHREAIEGLLDLATHAPSAINLQPWELVVVSGQEKERLSRLLVKRMKERNISCGPGSKSPLPEHYVQRERDLFDVMSPNLPDQISFQDFINEGSCNFYGAPTAIIITLDEVFSNARLTDIGILVGYFVLAAHDLGLGTCPVGLITAFNDDIKEELSLPDEKHVVIGIALGYPDTKASINNARSLRVPLDEVVKWR